MTREVVLQWRLYDQGDFVIVGILLQGRLFEGGYYLTVEVV